MKSPIEHPKATRIVQEYYLTELKWGMENDVIRFGSEVAFKWYFTSQLFRPLMSNLCDN